jgi:hypothetical protein
MKVSNLFPSFQHSIFARYQLILFEAKTFSEEPPMTKYHKILSKYELSQETSQ